jgi:hypothetical protein
MRPQPSTPDERVARIAAARFALITTGDATRAGMSRRQVEHRVNSGRWERLAPSVHRLAGAPETWQQVTLAACLIAGRDAVASHQSAGALLGVCPPPTVPHITVPPTASARTRLAVVHRAPLLAIDRTLCDRIPCTAAPRTLLDLGRTVERELLAALVDDVLSQNLCQPSEVLGMIRRSRWRTAGLLDVLGVWLEAIRPDSAAEMRLIRRLHEWGLPTPVRQHELRDASGTFVARLDLAWPRFRVGLEYDGARYHTPRHLAHDVAREERVRALGWWVGRADRDDLRPSNRRLRDELARRLRLGSAA